MPPLLWIEIIFIKNNLLWSHCIRYEQCTQKWPKKKLSDQKMILIRVVQNFCPPPERFLSPSPPPWEAQGGGAKKFWALWARFAPSLSIILYSPLIIDILKSRYRGRKIGCIPLWENFPPLACTGGGCISYGQCKWINEAYFLIFWPLWDGLIHIRIQKMEIYIDKGRGRG